MRKLPRRPELRSGRAGNDECGLEHRIYAPFPTQSQEVVRRQRQRLVELVHRLGPRVVYELIDHLDRDHGLGADLDRLLERFAGLDPEILRQVGGDRFASVHVVGGSR